jgi:hypothetical protein
VLRSSPRKFPGTARLSYAQQRFKAAFPLDDENWAASSLPFQGKHSQLLSVRSARAADVAVSHLFRHSDSYLYSGAALS